MTMDSYKGELAKRDYPAAVQACQLKSMLHNLISMIKATIIVNSANSLDLESANVVIHYADKGSHQ